MWNGKRLTVAIVALSILALSTAPAEALRFRVDALIWFSTSGDGNPFLDYEISGSHAVIFTRYTGVEALLPVTMVGNLKRGSGIWNSCYRAGFVFNRALRCSTRAFVPCPGAQGVWETETFGTILTRGFNQISGPLYANCVPPPCEGAPDSQVNSLIDLDSGLRVDRSISDGIDSSPMQRGETVFGKNFVLNEWAVITAGSDGIVIEKAASEPFAAHAESLAPSLSKALAEAGGRRYLLIQGREHMDDLSRPLVRFDPAVVPARLAGVGGKVVLKATFAGDGSLESAETIQGGPRLAESLVRGLAVDFFSANRHRVEVYAVFDLSNGVELLSAETIFILCCE